jgi:hypothetical protein
MSVLFLLAADQIRYHVVSAAVACILAGAVLAQIYGAQSPTMHSITIFNSIKEALRAGYQVYGHGADGYLVRTQTSPGWAIARVVLSP